MGQKINPRNPRRFRRLHYLSAIRSRPVMPELVPAMTKAKSPWLECPKSLAGSSGC
jgi:hypothetical protein